MIRTTATVWTDPWADNLPYCNHRDGEACNHVPAEQRLTDAQWDAVHAENWAHTQAQEGERYVRSIEWAWLDAAEEALRRSDLWWIGGEVAVVVNEAGEVETVLADADALAYYRYWIDQAEAEARCPWL